MDIEIFALCDAATDSGGKLNLLGAFDSLIVNSVPIVHPQCAVALRLRLTRMEAGEHQIQINIVDEDGKSVVPELKAKLNVRFPEDQHAVAPNMVMNLQQLKLEKAGEYSVDLAIDGNHERSIPLFVRLRPQQKN